MRLLYSLAWGLSLPFALLRLWLRGRQEPGYRRHIGERFGAAGGVGDHPACLWVHAVSAGETRAAEPLIRALLSAYPQHQLLLTHMTATGRATGASLFADVAPRLRQVYLPYDINWMMRRFLRHHRPQLCILMETEVWPNLIAQCGKQAIPVCLVNARLSEKSLGKARRLAALMVPAAHALAIVGAQSQPDAERLLALGMTRMSITGNMKFDVTPPPLMAQHGAALRERLGRRQIFLCASTRDGEESLILDAWMRLTTSAPEKPLLIITPRHPQRFDEVAQLLMQRGLRTVRRSQLESDSSPMSDIDVLLGDSMGEMYMYYAAADLAFVGGSLVALGGHNLIEAFAMGKPALTGPHTFNFSEITDQAIAAGAAVRVADADAMLAQALALLAKTEPRHSMGQAAHAFFLHHQGATARTMALLQTFIK
ncbi:MULTISPECIES: lipid IV(A) 3-deoxy-D-manno-octulosonic acid transferase [unclassified Undibacterium]|uniref:lipid IV(A) 3-deoxy-D-manno-octulosonic acid transferase n=1 Tax=unclassified Undibacterium TaxID=2630295 RepID=UPI002AC8EDAB|nr:MULTISPECIES: lipid IV(A) 3-deoxy-D-manno-octulosonic acid transferase [unclassified Undibacterium]MEB0139886.1 lipid IV(A) 3-deoxy-D-manno-octulosonic acid transferase [Undibacterium sp. CCC2.1]MEB0171845.1 lipid IV(A) 3-deoxy-D-manno-octulosonic acid transferase [Undibacterium sp. CCC1.1]MEB0175661.1 lipid IV(A) 3-deoxy-D-manno-octulosonic acid transferase [Undibacterium sp. CCC3.4]MEB0216243.1 lipid IV(A) 3-deoxy-D-manno-octulosonic acid transferase [Undibacterium sp. 5I2]WPX44135.1 lipi